MSVQIGIQFQCARNTNFARTLKQSILAASEALPVVLLTGPRQVGKTILFEMCVAEFAAPARAWVSLGDLDARESPVAILPSSVRPGLRRS